VANRGIGPLVATQAAGLLLTGTLAWAQITAAPAAAPIAMIAIDSNAKPGEAATLTGALEVTGGRALIAASGTISAGTRTAHVVLPRRGELRVCASTTVKLAADAGAAEGGVTGLLLAIDHGALELSLAGAAQSNSDVLLTPDFRILVSGPGAAEIKVRLGAGGDTCVENIGAQAPYVLVSSVFDGGAYRVQAGQHVSFQHGSLHEVVDQEKESCGCPPEARTGNEFPLAQSEGMEPLPKPAESPASVMDPEPLHYKGKDVAEQTAAALQVASAASLPQQAQKKPGVMARIGRFFRKLFGAEE